MQYRKLRRWWAGVLAVTFSTVVVSDQVINRDHSQRPIKAPVVTESDKDSQWYQEALHGISQPYPPSFRFLEDQGNWHTPFNHPGMPGRYDLRGWHR